RPGGDPRLRAEPGLGRVRALHAFDCAAVAQPVQSLAFFHPGRDLRPGRIVSRMKVSLERARRRTFAIISHPDAGKTTLTEKLLLYAGAIHIAGSVKARKASRYATSDWMEIE